MPLDQNILPENATTSPSVSRKLVRERAVELAAGTGHKPQDVSKADWEKAKHELMSPSGNNSTGSVAKLPKETDRVIKQNESLEVLLAGHPFLKGMQPEHLAILARHASEVEFTAGQVIFRQNEHARQFYLILQGSVTLQTYMARADDIPLQVVTAGDVLGWSWLFPPFVWHLQATAVQPTRAIFLDGSRLLVAAENEKHFGFQLMQRLANVVILRLEAAQQQLLGSLKQGAILPALDKRRRGRATGPQVPEALDVQLAEHPVFQSMKPEHLQILASAAMAARFEAGQVIFSEGDLANRFYLIQQGEIVLEASGCSAPFETVGDGDALGWSWLFTPFNSHFSARALTPTQAIFLYGTRLREHCEQDHEFGYALMKRTVAVVIKRLQSTRERIVEIANLKASFSKPAGNE